MSRVSQAFGKTQGKDRNFFFSMTILARWRLRKTWFLLAIVYLGVSAAVTIVCAVPLFTSLAEVTSLHELLNVSPTTGELNLSVTTQGISSSVEQGVQKIFDPLEQNTVGPYLNSTSQYSVTTTGVHVTAPPNLSTFAPLNIYATSLEQLKSHLQLIQGNWPQEHGSTGEIGALLTPEEARAMHVSVGGLLTLQGDFFTRREDMLGGTTPDPAAALQVRVTGLFEIPAQATPYLHGETFQPVINSEGTFYTLLLPAPDLLTRLDQVAREHGIDAVFSPLTFQWNWYSYLHTSQLQFSQVNDLVTQLTNYQAGVARALTSIQSQQNSETGLFNAPYVTQATLSNPTPGSFTITTLLNQYQSRIALVSIPLTILALQILALIIFFVGLVVTLLVERQLDTNALLSSRGASGRQIFWSLFYQGIALCALALVLGPLLAIWIVVTLTTRMLSGRAPDVLALVVGQPGQLFLTIGGYVLCVILVTLLTMGLLLRRATDLDVLALRRETARASYRPAWMRYYFDVTAAVIALTGYGVSLYLAGETRFLDLRTQSLILAPLALIAPAFLLLGGFLLLLRVFPALLQLGAWLSARRQGAPTMLALVQMARAPRQALRMTMLLALATAFAIFTLVFSATQVQHTADISAFETGADFSGKLPSNVTRFAATDLQAVTDLTAQYQHIPGVLSATVGYVDQGAVDQTPVEVRAVDASNFGKTGIWNGAYSSQSLPHLMRQLTDNFYNDIGSGTASVIIDETTRVKLNLNIGDPFIVRVNGVGDTSLNCVVLAIVQHIPTVNGSAAVADLSTSDFTPPGGILLNYATYNLLYQAMQQENLLHLTKQQQAHAQILPLPLNALWLRTSDGPAALASVRSALNSPRLFVSNLYDRREINTELQGDPLYLTILVLLIIGVVTTLLLALAGDLASSWLSVRSRLTSFTVLRALGATPRQIAEILMWEQGIMYVTSLVLGVVTGVILVLTVVPSLIFTSIPVHGVMSQFSDTEFYVIQRIVPAHIVVPTTLNIVLVMLLVICVAALVLMIRTALRPSMSQELRVSAD